MFFFFLSFGQLPDSNVSQQRWYSFVLNFSMTEVFLWGQQESVQPRKTSPTRSRICGQNAAPISEGRILWRVQMGRSRVTVGDCHISTRLAELSLDHRSDQTTFHWLPSLSQLLQNELLKYFKIFTCRWVLFCICPLGKQTLVCPVYVYIGLQFSQQH